MTTNKKVDTFQNRLIKLMDNTNTKAADLCRATGISKSVISRYVNGIYEAKQENLSLIAEYFDVSESYMMGYDVPKTRPTYSTIFPVERQHIPFLGSVACGEPIYADEQTDIYIHEGRPIDCDFCLRCQGDSMINARINDGDLVFVKKQDTVNNGDIACVIIDDSATLKRVYYYQDRNLLILKAENPKYDDMIYQGEELETIHILGKAVYFQSIIQ